MSWLLRLFRNLTGRESTATSPAASICRDFSRFAEGDRVMINGRKLSAPLRTNASIGLAQGKLSHNEIIGQPLSTLRLSTPDTSATRIEYPTLDQYIALTRRNVTPIYSNYAATIVSLLDLHAFPPISTPGGQQPAPRLEILEAGTGHGSLTIHLARTVAAANPLPPASHPPPARQSTDADRSSNSGDEWTKWRKSRRAIIHTTEKVPKHSLDAEKLIRGFRQGLYWPHIDFSIGGVNDWLQRESQNRIAQSKHADLKTGYLSYVILDLPSIEEVLLQTSDAMRDDAKILAFAPSITQIAECQKRIKRDNIPLVFERAVELGEGISTGRTWDVRIATPRVWVERGPAAGEGDAEHEASSTPEEDSPETSSDLETPDLEQAIAEKTQPAIQEDYKMVCRPKVGERLVGGGFVGLWRRIPRPLLDAENTS